MAKEHLIESLARSEREATRKYEALQRLLTSSDNTTAAGQAPSHEAPPPYDINLHTVDRPIGTTSEAQTAAKHPALPGNGPAIGELLLCFNLTQDLLNRHISAVTSGLQYKSYLTLRKVVENARDSELKTLEDAYGDVAYTVGSQAARHAIQLQRALRDMAAAYATLVANGNALAKPQKANPDLGLVEYGGAPQTVLPLQQPKPGALPLSPLIVRLPDSTVPSNAIPSSDSSPVPVDLQDQQRLPLRPSRSYSLPPDTPDAIDGEPYRGRNHSRERDRSRDRSRMRSRSRLREGSPIAAAGLGTAAVAALYERQERRSRSRSRRSRSRSDSRGRSRSHDRPTETEMQTLEAARLGITESLQDEIDSTVGVMRDNIQKVSERGESLHHLGIEEQELAVSAQGFRRGQPRKRKTAFPTLPSWQSVTETVSSYSSSGVRTVQNLSGSIYETGSSIFTSPVGNSSRPIDEDLETEANEASVQDFLVGGRAYSHMLNDEDEDDDDEETEDAIGSNVLPGLLSQWTTLQLDEEDSGPAKHASLNLPAVEPGPTDGDTLHIHDDLRGGTITPDFASRGISPPGFNNLF
jgi:hypothetical protein